MAGIGSAITGIIGAIMQAQAQQRALEIEQDNLDFQRSEAADRKKLATSARTDVYGNRQSYNPITNEWDVELSPTQRSLVGAGEREQLLSLTEDADRNRRSRRQQEERANELEPDYDAALAGMRYDEAPSERSIRDDLTGVMARNREASNRRGTDLATRQALRLGQGDNIPAILAQGQLNLGADAAGDELAVRQMALTEHSARDEAKRSKYLPALAQLTAFLDNVGTSPQMFSQLPEIMRGEQGQQLASLLNTLQSNAGMVGNSMQSLAGRVGASVPDLGSIGSGIDGIISARLNANVNGREREKPIIYNPSKGEEIYWPSDRLRENDDDSW